MKRILLALLSGAVLSAVATLALAGQTEYMPEECANTAAGTDIVGGEDDPDGGTTVTYNPGRVTVDLKLAGASCLQADYSVVVFDEFPGDGIPVVLDAISFSGDGQSREFTISRPVTDNDGADQPEICVNVTVSTTEHVESGSGTSGSSHPGGNGNAPPMQDSSTDTNSIDTETVVDWGAQDDAAVTCLTVPLSAEGVTSGSRGMN